MSRMSSFEQKIYKILKQENLSFVQEKQFKDLRNGLYRFDFYLPKRKIAIEVQGPQHYEFNSLFYKTRSDFLKAQERDRQKVSYCLAHDIILYCIPYWEIDNITCFNDILNDKFRAKSKFHNDEVWSQQKSIQ